MRNQKKRKQAGFTMVELMITAVISLIVMASVMSVFSNAVGSNASSLKSIRLNQELRAIMDVMVRDIRRSGYWSGSNGTNISSNPFSTMASNADGNCLTYSYDLDDDGSNDANDKQGFKLVDSGVSLRKNSSSCADTGANDWESISDSNSVVVTNLKFEVNDSLNACYDRELKEFNCASATHGGNEAVYMDVIDITLEANLVGDASVSGELKETVAVQNALTGIIP